MENDKERTSLYQWWVTHTLSRFYGTAAVICIVAYFLAAYYEIEWVRTLSCCIVFLLIIVFFIHYNQQNMHQFLYSNKDISHLPEMQIRKLNKVFLSIFLIAATVAMFITTRLPYERVLTLLWSMLRAALRFIIGLFKSDNESDVVEKLIPEEKQSLDLNSLFMEDEPVSEPNPILDYIVQILAILIVAAFICYVIYSIYKRIIAREKKLVFDKHEFISPFIKKSKLPEEMVYKDRALFIDRSPNGKIRRFYRRAILSRITLKHRSFSTLTPAEIERSVGLGDSATEVKLHELYEQARYSKDGCQKSDYDVLKRMQNQPK